jgi:hypothetical protein
LSVSATGAPEGLCASTLLILEAPQTLLLLDRNRRNPRQYAQRQNRKSQDKSTGHHYVVAGLNICCGRNKAEVLRIRKSASQSPFYGRRLRLLRRREDSFATPWLKTVNRAASLQLEENPDPANSRARRSIRNRPNNRLLKLVATEPSIGSGEQSQPDETQQRQHLGRRLRDGAGGSAYREIIKSIRTIFIRELN